jgi:hypothetical protein
VRVVHNENDGGEYNNSTNRVCFGKHLILKTLVNLGESNDWDE